MISFLNLKYFIVLCEELNFNSTAKILHITQQSLSGHIKKLENHFGTPLFEYGPPLKITDAGLLVKSYAQEILAKQQSLEEDIQTLKTAIPSTLSLGCTYARAQFLLPPIISDFQQRYPLTKINLFEGTTPEIEEALSQGRVDISLGFQPHGLKNITSIPLYKDPFRLVVAPSVLAQYFPQLPQIHFRCYEPHIVYEIIKTCPFLTMTPNTLIGQFGREYLENLQINPNKLLELRDVGTMLAMCSAGMGFMLSPETLIKHSYYEFSKEHLIYPLPDHTPMQISINHAISLQKKRGC